MTRTAVEQLAQTETTIVCADEQARRYYSILTEMMADYKKQALITGVKSECHCIICTVSLIQWNNLTKTWSMWTHEATQDQI